MDYNQGNTLIKKLVQAQLYAETRSQGIGPLAQSLNASLSIHLTLSSWCGQGWRYYINCLETALQDKTRVALSMSMRETSDRSMQDIPSVLQLKQTSTGNLELNDKPAKQVWHKLRRTCSSKKGSSTVPSRIVTAQLDTTEDQTPLQRQQFSFADLQHVHFIEEKANEALLVLRSNANTLAELKHDYSDILETDTFEGDTDHCKQTYKRFVKAISCVENDLYVQQSRAEMLLRLLADRRSLVRGLPSVIPFNFPLTP